METSVPVRGYDPERMNPPPGQGRDGPRQTTSRHRSAIGRRLYKARLAAKWTQARLAEEIGVDLATVQRWETGASRPRGLSLAAVERFLAGR